jgi:hypothetical protein
MLGSVFVKNVNRLWKLGCERGVLTHVDARGCNFLSRRLMLYGCVCRLVVLLSR